jgi:hypothetical protein
LRKFCVFQNQSVRRRKIHYKRLKKDRVQEAEASTSGRDGETAEEKVEDSEAEKERILEDILTYDTSCGGGGGMREMNVLKTLCERK